MSQWKILLQQLEIIETPSRQTILSEEKLLTFETDTGIILPKEYKEFCQIFGSGRFGDLVTIFCPSLSLLHDSNKSIEFIKAQIREYSSKDTQRERELESLLNSALIFGGDDRINIALWDLRTYSEFDKDYDIYWIKYDDFNDEIYKIGRNFFEFIQNFCLGRKFYEFLPKSMQPVLCCSFTPIQF